MTKLVTAEMTPRVEIDTEACAAYVRFSEKPVGSTKIVDVNNRLVTVDLDDEGQVVGVEMIGVHEFTLEKLRENLPFKVSKKTFDRAQLVAA